MQTAGDGSRLALPGPQGKERPVSAHQQIRLHQAMRQAHGLSHHVKVWLAGQPSRQFVAPQGAVAHSAAYPEAGAPGSPRRSN
jgi:hypothetical protein